MIKRYGCAVMLAFLLSCSPVQADRLGGKGWEEYTGYSGMRGLRLKPLIVEVHARTMIINGREIDAASALDLVGQSQTLSPVPDILVRANASNIDAANNFMTRVSNAGSCSERKCFYESMER